MPRTAEVIVVPYTARIHDLPRWMVKRKPVEIITT